MKLIKTPGISKAPIAVAAFSEICISPKIPSNKTVKMAGASLD